ncbi:hypothetical protein D3C75_690020 [compost metagenome]
MLEEVRIDFLVRQRFIRLHIVGQHYDLHIDSVFQEQRLHNIKNLRHRRNQSRYFDLYRFCCCCCCCRCLGIFLIVIVSTPSDNQYEQRKHSYH